MIRRFGAVIAVLIVLAGGSVAYATMISVPTTEAQGDIMVRGGVIRLGKKVYLHQNTSHAAVGITKVELVQKCDLRVHFDRKPHERVIAAIAEEDETMNRLGVSAGISGGVDYATVYLYAKGRKVCANSKVFGANANVWLQITVLGNGASTPSEPTPVPEPTPEAKSVAPEPETAEPQSTEPAEEAGSHSATPEQDDVAPAPE